MSTTVLQARVSALPRERSAASYGQWAALIGAALFAAIPLVWWPLADLVQLGMTYTEPPTAEMMRLHAFRHLLEFAAPPVLAFGLINLHRRRGRDLGAIGQVGLAVIVLGLVLRAALAGGIVLTEGFLSTQIGIFEQVHPSPIVTMLGSLAFGFAVFRNRTLSGAGGLLVALAAMAIFIELAVVGFGSGTAWLVAEGLMVLNALGFVLIGHRFWDER